MVARQVWFFFFQKLGLQGLEPQPDTAVFSTWWCRTIHGIAKDRRKGVNSLIILVVWEIWNRNERVFNNTTPSVSLIIQTVEEEGAMWCAAGAQNLRSLV